MKKLLILFLYLTLALCASAQISIKHNGTLHDLFSILQSKYGYSFMYSNSDVNDQQTIKINLINSNIEAIFKQISETTNVAYTIKNKQIAIKKADSKVKTPKTEIKAEPKIIESKPIEQVEIQQEESVVEKESTEINTEKIIEETKLEKVEIPLPTDKEDSIKVTNDNVVTPQKVDAETKQETAPKTNNNNMPVIKAKLSPWKFLLTTNLLYDLAATLNAGIELKYTERYSLALNSGWMHLNWGDQKKYHIWFVNPQVRYYFTNSKRYYLGGELHVGELNFKFSDIGNQGNFTGGGLTFGYIINMKNNLKLDLGIGLGYTRYKYDTYYYDYDSKQNIRKESGVKNLWLPKLGITLVWTIK